MSVTEQRVAAAAGLQIRLQKIIGELTALRRGLEERQPAPPIEAQRARPARALAGLFARPAGSPQLPSELTVAQEIAPGVKIVFDQGAVIRLNREAKEEAATDAALHHDALTLSYSGRGWFSLEITVAPEEIGDAAGYELALSVEVSRRINCRLLLASLPRGADSDQRLEYFPIAPEERDYRCIGDFSKPAATDLGRDAEYVFIAVFETGGDVDLELHSMQLSFTSGLPSSTLADGRSHVPGSVISDALTYWEEIFKEYATQGNPLVKSLLDPAQPIQPEIEQIVRSYLPPSARRVRVLDVGCGPVSGLGKRGAGIEFDVLGVDPLTDEYGEILSRHRLQRPHQAVVGTGETIDGLFASDSFDFVYSKNALDHCSDAPLVIRNMVKIAKPGTKIFVNVCQNGAENAAYSGSNRWNFDVLCDQVVVWNPGSIEFLDALIDGHPYEFRMYDRPAAAEKYPRQIDIVIHKNGRDGNTLVELEQGIFGQFSSARGWLTILATRNLDEDFQFFVHGLMGSEWIAEPAFRWYNHRSVRSVRLPRHAYTEIRLGQFYRDYRKAGAPCVNLWRARLRSID